MKQRFFVPCLPFIFMLICMALPSIVLGDVSNDVPHEEKGYQKTSYSLSEHESINLASGNLTFRVPLHTLKTDGGLEYTLAATFNSKFWNTRRYCNLSGAGYDNCQLETDQGPMVGTVLRADVADGVEAFGFGWDLRPARILFHTGAQSATVRVLVDSSGATHKLHGAPPWENSSRAADATEDSVGNQYFTSDGTNFRFTVQSVSAGKATSIRMEDGKGSVYLFSQIVPELCDADFSLLGPGLTNLSAFNFHNEVSGLYLSEIQRGPWSSSGSTGGDPANRIIFTYRGSNADWSDTCGSVGYEQFLPATVTASGSPSRTITLNYTGAVLDSLTVPIFDPTLGGLTANESDDIDWITSAKTFQQVNGTPNDLLSFSAKHLDRISFPNSPDPVEFSFDSGLTAGFLPLQTVTLPSGAVVEYTREDHAYPVGFVKHHPADPFLAGPRTYNCGADVPYPSEDQTSENSIKTYGVTKRTISYFDASSDSVPRQETTFFSQGMSCAGIPELDPDTNPNWPYNFDFALRDDDTPVANPYEQDTEYLWTVVSTQAGDGTDGAGGTVYQAVTAEIHRFHPLTREEFSSDIVANSSGSVNGIGLLHAFANFDRWDEQLSNPTVNIRILRHTETERSVLSGDDDIKDLGYNRDRYTFISRQSTFTDESSVSTSANIKGLTPCYPDVTPGATPVNPSCTEVTSLSNADNYLNPLASDTQFYDPVLETTAHRYSEWTYDYLNAEDSFVWSLSRQESAKIWDGAAPANISESAFTWTNLSDAPVTVQRYFTMKKSILNPDANGACTADCVSHVYGYDLLGNPQTDLLSGGYGSAGFGTLATTTETTFKHGVPQKKKLTTSSTSLLLWEREIDPNTGLPRWHVDGSGIGFAYLWDELGRPTDVAPIDGMWTAPLGPWVFNHQKTGVGGTVPVKGLHFDYVQPTASSLLEHSVYDATWSGTLLSGSLPVGSYGSSPRAVAVFDGLGRLTRESENYPQGTRSRFNIDFIHSPGTSNFPICDADNTWDISEKGRINLGSEWIDGTSFPSNCDLPWTETQLDPLARPAKTRIPDGSLTTMAFIGDTSTSMTRSIATGITASGEVETTNLSRETINDSLGRLRRLKEEVDSGSFVVTDYDYDQSDRLTKVSLFKAGSTDLAQTRSFTYTDAGFLSSSVEPERLMMFSGYDAAGNVTRQYRYGSGIIHNSDYDDFGRFLNMTENSSTLVEQSWSTVGQGNSSYNRVIESTRHNRFGATDVAVTHKWTYGGPGGRVSVRKTGIAGLGDPGDEFHIGYSYDPWGNRSEVTFPTWNNCRGSRFAGTKTTFNGRWATGIDFVIDMDTTSDVATATYHPSGRTHTVTYSNTGSSVIRTETADPNGMARPRNIVISGGSADLINPGASGIFSYDGIGNIWMLGGERYIYDGLGRLVESIKYKDGGGGDLRTLTTLQEFSYDRWGNQEEIKSYNELGALVSRMQFLLDKSGAGIPNTNRIDDVVDDLSKSTVTLGWDARGNLSHQPAVGDLREKTYTWSEDDRLMQSDDAGGTWAYAYDAAGERVARWHNPGSGVEAVVTVRDEAGQALSEWRNVAGTQFFDVVRDSAYFGGTRIAELDHTAGNDSIHYISSDHLGSPMIVFDQSGDLVGQMSFEPFGALDEDSSPTPVTPHLFTGHERDLGTASSELDYMHARYYSPGLARFVSVDPVLGDTTSSQSWNRYSYVLNNPLKLVDPDGECVQVAAAIPLAAGAIAADAAMTALVVVGAIHIYDHLTTPGPSPEIVVEPLQGFEPAGEMDMSHPNLIPMTVLAPPLEGQQINQSPTDSTLASSSTDGAGKNEPHGDSGRAQTKAESQIEALTEQLKTATGREKVRIKNKIQNIKKAAAKSRKGDTDHRDTRQTDGSGSQGAR